MKIFIFTAAILVPSFFLHQANAFDGAVIGDGSEFRLDIPPLGSVEINNANSYWQGSQENVIYRNDYESYVDRKMEKLQQGDPDAFKSLVNSPVRETREETKLKLGFSIGRDNVEFSA